MVKVLHDAGIAVKLPWVLQELLDRFSDSYMYGSSEWIDAPFAVHCVPPCTFTSGTLDAAFYPKVPGRTSRGYRA